MDGQPRPARFGEFARTGIGCAVWLGVIDASRALDLIGPMNERWVTMGIAIVLDGLLLGLAAAAALKVVARFTPPNLVDLVFDKTRALAYASMVIAPVVGSWIAVVGAGEPTAPSASAQPNVLLISIDTLRADHLSAYGYERTTSPNIDALAREGTLFKDAYSHSTWTLPAHASMFTGLDPVAHNVLTREDRVQYFHHTLTERLVEDGYDTAAWVGTRRWGYMGGGYGFAAGFSRYEHWPHPKRYRSSRIARAIDQWVHVNLERGVGNASDQVDAIISWLSVDRSKPFFAYAHFYDVHSKTAELPYEAPPPFLDQFCPGALDDFEFCDDGVCATDRLLEIVRRHKPALTASELDVTRCLYDGGIAYIDSEVGRLFDALRHHGLYENTLIVVTSDHGEGFFEHASPLHITLHNEVTHIPLIIRGPGLMAGKRATGNVRQSDFAPTILSLLGSQQTRDLQGQSFADVLTQWNATVERPVLALDRNMGGFLLRSGDYSLIQYPSANALDGMITRELYDHSKDPLQTRSQASERPAVLNRMFEQLAAMKDRGREIRDRLSEGGTVEAVVVSDEARAELRALGYIDEESD